MKKIFTVFTIYLISSLGFALPFNSKVTDEDLKLLEEGKVVARNIDKFKNIGIESDSPLIARMKEQIKDLSTRICRKNFLTFFLTLSITQEFNTGQYAMNATTTFILLQRF